MLIMQCCQPLVLIFQLFKILEQRTLPPPSALNLNPGFVPDKKDDLQVFNRYLMSVYFNP